MTNLSKTENLIKTQRKEVGDSDLCHKIEIHVRDHYLPVGAAFDTQEDDYEIDLYEDMTPDDLSETRAELAQICGDSARSEKLSPQEIFKIHKLIALERRRKDKNLFVDLMGEPELVEIIKELFPMFCVPLGDLYAQAEFPQWFNSCFKWIKCVYTIADEKVPQEQKTQHLSNELGGYYQAHYHLLHNMIKGDSGVVERACIWLYNKFRVGDGIEMDAQYLLDSIPIEQKAHATERRRRSNMHHR